MKINTNCVRYELPKVRVVCDSVINSSIAFFFYGLSLNSLHSSYERNLACVWRDRSREEGFSRGTAKPFAERGGDASRGKASKTLTRIKIIPPETQATRNLKLTIEKHQDNLNPRALSNSFLLWIRKILFF